MDDTAAPSRPCRPSLSTYGFPMSETAVAVIDDRATFVRERLVAINKSAGDMVYENGLLLREYMANAYFKEDGFKSFDAAIDSMQDSGQLDYGARNARNFIAIVDLFDTLHLPPAEVQNIGISKLREIAMLADPKEQQEDRKSTRLNSSHRALSRMPSSA